jgi:filamentous hemagglutinin family protein
MMTTRRHRSIFSSNLISFLISGLILQGILPAFSHAASNITPDGTMGTTINQVGNIYNIDGGRIKGTNQFHSFGLFSVGTGDTASFNGPPVISNIICRVTGGQESVIDGILRSTILGANLYLLNPSGVLFGPNASLDVSGCFHVSTADYLRFSDGARFYANLSNNSTLTSAPIAAFGFLTNSPAPISIQGSNLNVPEGQTLSVVGGDIQINSGALLKAAHGQINIASVASPGEVIPNLPAQLPALDVSSFTNLGKITESGSSNVTVSSSAGAGTVLIRGGQLVMDNAYVNANTTGNLDGNALGIDVQLTGDLGMTNNAEMLTSSAGAGRAGDIRINADSMEISERSFIYSYSLGSRDSGHIEVATNSLTVKDGAYIGTETYSTGNSGNVTVNTCSLEVVDGSYIFTGTYGLGNSGKLEIQADDILISGGPIGGVVVGSFTAGKGNCGDVLVTAKNLQILNNSELSSTVYWAGSGNGGTIELTADRVVISGDLANSGIYTGIFANTFGEGKGGSLNLTANSLEMTNRASLQALTLGTGDAGNITLRVGTLELKDASCVSSTGYYGLGVGNSGNIEVSANRVFISGLENSTQPFNVDATGFFTGSLQGYGGDVYIKTDSLTMTNRGLISSTSYGSGRAGNIKVDAQSVELLNGAFMLSSAYGSGNGGNIEVIADSVLVSGVHPAPVSDITGNISLTPSGIGSQAFINGGNAGDVGITAGTLNVLDGARISTQTFGAGNGGNIEITANNVLISGVNTAFKEFLIGQGIGAEEAGKLASASLLTSTNGSFLGSGTTGNAGNMQITARNVQVQDGGLISSKTETSGNGGNIELIVDRLNLFNRAAVSAESSGAGYAGNIGIKATDTLLIKDSSITTEAKYTDGGNIKVDAGYMVNLIDSKITASVGGGPQTVGGNITIDPQYVILNDSQIIANAYEGKGGNIKINADVFLASPESIVDASSALGINGTVDIQAPIQNISGILVPMQGSFLLSETLLRDRCMAKIRGEKYSSLIVSGRDGLPIRPGSVLPSPIY